MKGEGNSMEREREERDFILMLVLKQRMRWWINLDVDLRF